MKKFYIFIPLLILLFSVNTLIFNEDFYINQANNYDEDTISNLLSFFKGSDLNFTLYSEEEILHLYDVRNLILASIITTIFLFTLILVNFLREDKEIIKDNLILGGSLSIGLTAALSLVFLNFSSSFQKFHEIFFTNNYWQLPSDSTLIQLFPETFFFNALLHIVLYSITFSLLIIVIGVKIPEKDGT